MRTRKLRNSVAMYEVQFQETGKTHSQMDDLEKAKLYAKSLANWNHAAQVFAAKSTLILCHRQTGYHDIRVVREA